MIDDTRVSYTNPMIMQTLWEVMNMPGGVAILSFNNQSYEVTVKKLGVQANTKPKSKLAKSIDKEQT